MAVHLAVVWDVFSGVLFCAVFFPHEMSWVRSGTELSQFLKNFPTYSKTYICIYIILVKMLIGRSYLASLIAKEIRMKSQRSKANTRILTARAVRKK